MHVALDPEKDPQTGRPRETAQEGKLYAVSYRALESRVNGEYAHWTFDLRVNPPTDLPDRMNSHLGGERRPVAVSSEGEWPAAPEELRVKVTSSKYISLTLLTPAIFDEGWKPGWLESGQGALAPLRGAKLLGAAVGRAEAVSGWNFDLQNCGPKATRRMVPAGSTYFLELPEALSKEQFDALWLHCVSDQEADRRDGYGLAVLGHWQPQTSESSAPNQEGEPK